jgi:hypothetical protein
LYGCYLVFLQREIGNEERLDMAMFFGTRMNTVALELGALLDDENVF